MPKFAFALKKIIATNAILFSSCLSAKVVAETSSFFSTKSKVGEDVIPDEWLDIRDNVLYGFLPSVKQSDLYNGEYITLQIPTDVVEIKDYAFTYMFDGVGTFVHTLILGSSLQKIGSYAFYGCHGITNLSFYEQQKTECSLTYIGDCAFQHSGISGNLNIPDTVTHLGARAFSDCSGLIALYIHNNFKFVGEYAFANCSNVSLIDLNRLSSIPLWMYEYKAAFHGVGTEISALKTVYINIGVNSKDEWDDAVMIRQEAKHNLKIPQFTLEYQRILPRGDLNVKNGVLKGFASGVDLSKYDVLRIDSDISEIDENAFYNEKSDTGVIKNCRLHLDLQTANLVIKKNAFRDCTGLVGDVDWLCVSNIKEHAFDGCVGLSGKFDSERTKEVLDSAFKGCTGLTSLRLTYSLDLMEENAFNGCSGVTFIDLLNFSGDAFPIDWYWTQEGTNLPLSGLSKTGWILLNPTNVRVSDWKSFLPRWGIDLTSSESYEDSAHWKLFTKDFTAKSIDTHFSYSHNNTIVRGLSEKGKSSITFFKKIVFNDKSMEIMDSAFKDVWTKEEYPNYEWILNLNVGLNKIGKHAFENNTKLISCETWPATLLEIQDYAFYNCKYLRGHLTLPLNLKYLGDAAFTNCNLLSSNKLVIPSSIEYVGQSALLGVKIQKLVFEKFTGKICDFAFANNDALTSIDLTAYDSIPSSRSWVLSNYSFAVSGAGTVYVKSGPDSAEEWKQFLWEHGLPHEWTVEEV